MIQVTEFDLKHIAVVKAQEIEDGQAYVCEDDYYPANTVFIGCSYHEIAAISLCGNYVVNKASDYLFRKVKMTVQIGNL